MRQSRAIEGHRQDGQRGPAGAPQRGAGGQDARRAAERLTCGRERAAQLERAAAGGHTDGGVERVYVAQQGGARQAHAAPGRPTQDGHVEHRQLAQRHSEGGSGVVIRMEIEIDNRTYRDVHVLGVDAETWSAE